MGNEQNSESSNVILASSVTISIVSVAIAIWFLNTSWFSKEISSLEFLEIEDLELKAGELISNPDLNLPDRILKYDGKLVQINGYFSNWSKCEDGTRKFLFHPESKTVLGCFSSNAVPVQSTIVVELAEGIEISGCDSRIRVTGMFTIRATAISDEMRFMYLITDGRIELLQHREGYTSAVSVCSL